MIYLSFNRKSTICESSLIFLAQLGHPLLRLQTLSGLANQIYSQTEHFYLILLSAPETSLILIKFLSFILSSTILFESCFPLHFLQPRFKSIIFDGLLLYLFSQLSHFTNTLLDKPAIFSIGVMFMHFNKKQISSFVKYLCGFIYIHQIYKL